MPQPQFPDPNPPGAELHLVRAWGVAGATERQVRLPRQDGRHQLGRGLVLIPRPPSRQAPAAASCPLPPVLGPGGCGRRPRARALGSDDQ